MSSIDSDTMNTEEIFQLALNYYHGNGVSENKKESAELWQKLADLDHTNAALNLAVMYRNGDGVVENKKKAAELYQQASDLGNSSATCQLAIMYIRADGVVEDKKKAAKLFQKAADAKNPDAAYNLAVMYYYADGINKDTKKAADYFQKASTLGHKDATLNLAIMYLSGQDIEEDKIQAAKLFEKASELGCADSMNNLALMYMNGDGVNKNQVKVIKLLKKAVKHGSALAMNNLGLMYKHGDGVEENLKEALKLIEEGTRLGSANAMYSLAIIYEEGQCGIVKDRERAADLFTQAEKNGFLKAALYAPHKLIAGLFNKDSTFLPLKKHFLELEYTIRNIKKRHIYKDEAPLAHFTSWPAIESILSEETDHTNLLRLYNVDYMNDPTEGRSLINFKNTELTKTNVFLNNIFKQNTLSNKVDTINSLPPSIYSLSFTESSDRLDLWRAYGNDGDGFSIVTVFPNNEDDSYKRQILDSFVQHQNQSIHYQQEGESVVQDPPLNTSPILFRVFYKDKDKLKTLKELSIPLNKIQNNLSKFDESAKNEVYYVLYAALLEIMYLYKDEQYSTEKEVRAIQAMCLDDVQLDERKPGRLYCKTAPFLFKNISSKIIIGPKVKDRQVALWNLRYRLKKNGFGNTTSVKFSDVNYR